MPSTRDSWPRVRNGFAGGAPHFQAARARIVADHRRVGLHGEMFHPLGLEPVLHHRESLVLRSVHVAPVQAEPGGQIARLPHDPVPHEGGDPVARFVFVNVGRIGPQGILDGEHRGQIFVLHVDELHGPGRRVLVHRGHGRDDVRIGADFVRRQNLPVADGVPRPVQLGHVPGGDHRRHARQRQGFRRVDAHDFRMGPLAVGQPAVQHSREFHIRGVLGPARRDGHPVPLRKPLAHGPDRRHPLHRHRGHSRTSSPGKTGKTEKPAQRTAKPPRAPGKRRGAVAVRTRPVTGSALLRPARPGASSRFPRTRRRPGCCASACRAPCVRRPPGAPPRGGNGCGRGAARALPRW